MPWALSPRGINVLNGVGTIGLIRTTRSTNGEILDWTDQPNGHPPPNETYTVDPDCTGTFLNNLNNLVVLDGGKRYLLLSVAPGTTVTEEGIRIEEDSRIGVAARPGGYQKSAYRDPSEPS